MNGSMAGFRKLGSFVAGIMIGSSMMIPVLVVTAEKWGRWQTLGLVSSGLLLLAGLALQAVVSVERKRDRA